MNGIKAPLDIKEAIAGAPVRLRSGKKAYVSGILKYGENKLVGYKDGDEYFLAWDFSGALLSYVNQSEDDIVGMWEAPKEDIVLTLPHPLKLSEIQTIAEEDAERYLCLVLGDTKKTYEAGFLAKVVSDHVSKGMPLGQDFAVFDEEVKAARWLSEIKKINNIF